MNTPLAEDAHTFTAWESKYKKMSACLMPHQIPRILAGADSARAWVVEISTTSTHFFPHVQSIPREKQAFFAAQALRHLCEKECGHV